MNLKLKILISILIIVAITLLDCIILINCVKAVNISQIKNVDLHYGGMCESLLKKNGVIVKTTYVEYYGENGINYPAYCLDRPLERCYS